MTYATETLAGFDTETTGPDPETARIVELAVLTQTPGAYPGTRIADRLRHAPPVDVPQGATDVHGITTADLETATPARDVLEATLAALGDLADEEIPVVIYNASYDLTVLDADLVRYGLGPLPPLTVIDPLVLDRHYDRYRKGKRTLTAAAAHYGIELVDAHGAQADTAASIAVARAIAARYDVPTDRAKLHALQTQAYATWARSFAEYLRKVGADRPPPSTVWVDPRLLGETP